ncbi:MAG: ABC transporter ATP-binding protein [Alphaproteobacteria bacterium]|nr:ABC transporter ATP-binding protein [Alphaproteobacteria bacterium]
MSSEYILPKSMWKFYWKYGFRGQWGTIIAWAICALAVKLDLVLFPFYEKWIVALLEKPIPDGVSWIAYILPTILLIVALDIMINIILLYRGVFEWRWGPNIDKQVSVILTNYTQSQTLSWWVSRLPGKVNQQMNYVQNAKGMVSQIWAIFGYFIVTCVNSLMIFSVNIYVAIMFLVLIAFRVWFSLVLRKSLKDASEKQANANSTLSGKLMDSLSNYSIVKSFSGLKREEKYLEPHRNKKIETNRRYGFVNRIFSGVPGILWDIMYGATLFFCAMLYFRGELAISEVVFTLTIFYNTAYTIGVLIDSMPDLIDTISSASHSYKELVTPIEITDIDNAPDLVVDRGAIEFKNVSFKYRRQYVLRDFNLKIKSGERVGIVGLSGAGKTTLVNLLMRFYNPNRGSVLIDNQDIAKVSQDSLRENISYIPQEPTMFNRTILENIEYGRPGASLREIKAAAAEASADEFINTTEKKYNSLVGDRGIKLSGGQRQRIAIARAFLKNAPILILDEATSALDSETEIAIQKSFDKLSSGHTTLVVAHRLSTLRNMDRIIVLDKGRVVESGTHNSLLRKKGLYAKLWKMQSGGFLQ